MTIETPRDLAGMMAIGRVVGQALARMSQAVRPGMTTAELDEVGRLWLESNGARPAPAITYGFPGVACISINEEAAHGIPGERVIEPGDIVKIDVSAERGGFFADAAVTVIAAPAPPERERLVRCAAAALDAAIEAAQAGRPMHGMGAAAERVARRSGYAIVRELCAHGIGRSLHEAPGHIPQFYRAQSAQRLAEGLVITVEPHVAAGVGRISEQPNGWTLSTLDGRPVAAFEHTIIVTRGRPIIVTAVA